MKENISLRFRYSYLISAILLMIMHISGGHVGDKISIESKLCWIICKCGMPALGWFVFASAYFMFRDYKRDYKDLLLRKVKTLLIPYFTWNVIGLIWYRLVYDRVFCVETKITLPLIIDAFTPFKAANGGTWTIAMFMLFSVAAPGIYFLCKKRECIGIIILGYLSVIIWAKTRGFLYWLPLYLFGAYMAIHHRENIEEYLSISVEKKWLRVLGGVIAVSIYIVAVYASIVGVLNEDILIFISPFLMLPIMRYVFIWNVSNWFTKSASFLIYMSHGLLAVVIGPLIQRRFREAGILKVYILCILVVTAIEMLFLVMVKYLSRFKIMRIFTGGR